MLALPSYTPSYLQPAAVQALPHLKSYPSDVGIFPSQHIFTPPILFCLAHYRLFSRRQPLSTHLADQCPVTDSTPIRYGSLADIWYLCHLVESGEPASRPRSTFASELSSPEVAPDSSPAACRGSTRTLIRDTTEFSKENIPSSD